MINYIFKTKDNKITYFKVKNNKQTEISYSEYFLNVLDRMSELNGSITIDKDYIHNYLKESNIDTDIRVTSFDMARDINNIVNRAYYHEAKRKEKEILSKRQEVKRYYVSVAKIIEFNKKILVDNINSDDVYEITNKLLNNIGSDPLIAYYCASLAILIYNRLYYRDTNKDSTLIRAQLLFYKNKMFEIYLRNWPVYKAIVEAFDYLYKQRHPDYIIKDFNHIVDYDQVYSGGRRVYKDHYPLQYLQMVVGWINKLADDHNDELSDDNKYLNRMRDLYDLFSRIYNKEADLSYNWAYNDWSGVSDPKNNYTHYYDIKKLIKSGLEKINTSSAGKLPIWGENEPFWPALSYAAAELYNKYNIRIKLAQKMVPDDALLLLKHPRKDLEIVHIDKENNVGKYIISACALAGAFATYKLLWTTNRLTTIFFIICIVIFIFLMLKSTSNARSKSSTYNHSPDSYATYNPKNYESKEPTTIKLSQEDRKLLEDIESTIFWSGIGKR